MGGGPLILAAAMVADRLIGDPESLWRRTGHPVAWAGHFVAFLDRRLNDDEAPPGTRQAMGVAAVALLAVASIASGLAVAALLDSAVGRFIEGAIVAILLAQKSLLDYVRAVAEGLDADLDAGRAALARIVGRDVASLDESAIVRGAVESLAENFSDGVVAPAFWYAVAGLPGLFLYKVANTADSMIGHRSPRHEAFGWAAARLDDILNLLPARLAAGLIAAGAALAGFRGRAALDAAIADAGRHRSPNAGWPEAAMAGALGVALGGPRTYGGAPVDGAWLNADGRRELTRADIANSLRLVERAWAISLALVLLVALGGRP